jgi:thiamine transport system substrate-binding protein
MPLNMFVFPVREGTALPVEFERFAATPDDVIEVDPFELGEAREDLLARWRDIVVR